MAKFATRKPYDGTDHQALIRGINWLMAGNPAQAFIYTPAKRNAQDMASDTTMPDPLKELFKQILKSNSVKIDSTNIGLCFGSGAGSCGTVPEHGSTARILLCYANPNSVGWLLTRAPNADVCLLPWTAKEAEDWRKCHSPTIV